jgi:mannose-1-phosphate guanylyltransferase/mannose-6-phosphate isomerase
MFQQTLHWVHPRFGFNKPILMGNQRHQDLIKQQSTTITQSQHQIIYEPIGRNTAASILMAALLASRTNPRSILLSLPSDHILEGRAGFSRALEAARSLAEKNRLVVFGITPQSPDSSYGYIVKGKAIDDQSFHITRFVEKPQPEVASSMLEQQSALWNSGMLMFKASKLISEMRQHQPKLLEQCRTALKSAEQLDQAWHVPQASYEVIPELSIDHGLLEKSCSLACVSGNFHWSDVGSWNAIAALSKAGVLPSRDSVGTEEAEISSNILQGDAIESNCHNTYLRSESRLVAAVGVKNLVVIVSISATSRL